MRRFLSLTRMGDQTKLPWTWMGGFQSVFNGDNIWNYIQKKNERDRNDTYFRLKTGICYKLQVLQR